MPAIVVPDEGELFLLDVLLRGSTPGPFKLHLYSNNFAPLRDSILADFTPASYTGYEPVDLSRSEWSEADTVGGYAQSEYGTGYIEFLSESGTEQIYGYYVTDADETVCLWAQKFDAGIEVSSTNPVLIQPVLRLRSESQPES